MKQNGKIQFIQHNANRNSHIIHTCLNYAIKLKTDFILFQEPFVVRDNITTQTRQFLVKNAQNTLSLKLFASILYLPIYT